MSEIFDKFMVDSEVKSFDLKHRSTIAYNMSKYDAAVSRGKQQYLNLAMARRQASLKKYKSIEHLEDSLKDFELNFIKNGGKVLWAQDADEANALILDILQRHKVQMLVKSKSMVTEELQLDHFLKPHGIESIETDLGEYIVQISGDKPYHIVTPVMHKSAADIGLIFHEKFGLDPESTPQQITAFVRTTLREKFATAGAGITGANFLISNSGSVALTENEGNGVLSASMPPLHIVVAGIEKVIENIDDLHLFWPLLATFGTGQNITAYNSIISGPRQKDEVDGPTEMYVILLDNGRSRLLAQTPQRRALSCIRCGSCLNGCPVYHNIGGHTYGSVYSGPIGAVITPHLNSMMHYKHLSYATSLCGKCTEVCPVNIDLHHLLLENRNTAVKNKLSTRIENLGMYAWKKVMMNRKLMDFAGAKMKNFALKKLFAKSWGKRRDLPPVAAKNFGQLWQERSKK
ncbi:MAG: lactate utilization protein [Bacteroidetes bacterium]|nr:MAG: lactate utilization protein [Bacteroidota bacterium]